MTNNTRTGLMVLMLVPGLSGCGGSGVASGPSAPSPVPPSVSPPPPSNTPVIATIVPNAGSTRGEGWATITGTGFERGARVTLDGLSVGSFVQDATTMTFWTIAHAAGTFDVVVTNPGGLAARLARGYTYALPDSFEVNGNWEGGADSNYETALRFTVQNNRLTSASCGNSATVTLSPPPAISDGVFSFHGDDGTSISGRIVAPDSALGTIDIAPCAGYPWFAKRQS